MSGGASACPGCGIALPDCDGPSHAYLGASPACWALYGELIAWEIEAGIEARQLSVDTYAVQHPGRPQRRSAQSVGLHLTTLCMFVEQGTDPRHGAQLHRRLVKPEAWPWLEPPAPIGRLTVADVLSAEEYSAAARAWAEDVWDAWAPHRDTVRQWVKEGLS